MNKNKLVAGLLLLFVFLVPFRMLYITDEIVDGGKYIGLLFATIIGFFMAFGIATNEPFRKKAEMKVEKKSGAERIERKKAA